jgi:ribonuclease-3
VRRLSHLERKLGHSFRDRALLEAALTHPSHAHEAATAVHYERLEFLGDAVLGFLLAELIYRRRPELDQGGMTRLRSRLANAHALAARARELALGDHIRLGRGETRSGGKEKISVLADVFESVVAAIFIDGGVRAARAFLRRCCRESVDRLSAGSSDTDPKTGLQELLQARGQDRPTYRVVGVEGPQHRRRFRVEAVLDGQVAGRGEGGSKKEAEREAAREVLASLVEA